MFIASLVIASFLTLISGVLIFEVFRSYGVLNNANKLPVAILSALTTAAWLFNVWANPIKSKHDIGIAGFMAIFWVMMAVLMFAIWKESKKE